MYAADQNILNIKRIPGESTQSDNQDKDRQVKRQKKVLQAHKTVALMGKNYIIYIIRKENIAL